LSRLKSSETNELFGYSASPTPVANNKVEAIVIFGGP
jgi:hypothetical protein